MSGQDTAGQEAAHLVGTPGLVAELELAEFDRIWLPARRLLAALSFAAINDSASEGWLSDEQVKSLLKCYERRMRPDSLRKNVGRAFKGLREALPRLALEEKPGGRRILRPVPISLAVWLRRRGKDYIVEKEWSRISAAPVLDRNKYSFTRKYSGRFPAPLPPTPLEPRTSPDGDPLGVLITRAERLTVADPPETWGKMVGWLTSAVETCPPPTDVLSAALFGRLCAAAAQMYYELNIRADTDVEERLERIDFCRVILNRGRAHLSAYDTRGLADSDALAAALSVSEAEGLVDADERARLLAHAEDILRHIWQVRCAILDRAGMAATLFTLAEIERIRLLTAPAPDPDSFHCVAMAYKQAAEEAYHWGVDRLVAACNLRWVDLMATAMSRCDCYRRKPECMKYIRLALAGCAMALKDAAPPELLLFRCAILRLRALARQKRLRYWGWYLDTCIERLKAGHTSFCEPGRIQRRARSATNS